MKCQMKRERHVETDLEIGGLCLVYDELGYCVELAITWKCVPAKQKGCLTSPSVSLLTKKKYSSSLMH